MDDKRGRVRRQCIDDRPPISARFNKLGMPLDSPPSAPRAPYKIFPDQIKLFLLKINEGMTLGRGRKASMFLARSWSRSNIEEGELLLHMKNGLSTCFPSLDKYACKKEDVAGAELAMRHDQLYTCCPLASNSVTNEVHNINSSALSIHSSVNVKWSTIIN